MTGSIDPPVVEGVGTYDFVDLPYEISPKTASNRDNVGLPRSFNKAPSQSILMFRRHTDLRLQNFNIFKQVAR